MYRRQARRRVWECFGCGEERIHGSALLHRMAYIRSGSAHSGATAVISDMKAPYPERLRAFRGNGDPQAVREGGAAIPFRPCGDGERLAALIGVRHSLDTGFLLRVRRARRLCRQAVRTAQGLWCRHAAAGPRLRGGGGVPSNRFFQGKRHRDLSSSSSSSFSPRVGGGGSHGGLLFRQPRFPENDGGMRGRLAGREPYADGLTMLVHGITLYPRFAWGRSSFPVDVLFMWLEWDAEGNRNPAESADKTDLDTAGNSSCDRAASIGFRGRAFFSKDSRGSGTSPDPLRGILRRASFRPCQRKGAGRS